MFESRQTHRGQYKPYGDFVSEWDIKSDLPKEEVTEWTGKLWQLQFKLHLLFVSH